MNTKLITILSSLAFAVPVMAAPQTFDFKDPKGVNNVVFHLDAPLESINGSANGISGIVLFDPEKPADTKGKITVASETLMVPNPMMKGHLHSDAWMNTAKYPEITFDVRELKDVKTDGDMVTGNAVGDLTLHGVTREMTVPVKLTYLKDKLGARVPNMKGDLLVIRANFSVKRSDFDINPKAPEDKVPDEVDLILSIAGASPK